LQALYFALISMIFVNLSEQQMLLQRLPTFFKQSAPCTWQQ
jgi:hypothetical protein